MFRVCYVAFITKRLFNIKFIDSRQEIIVLLYLVYCITNIKG